MKFSVLTLFPEQLQPTLQTSIIGRALDNGLLDVSLVAIRDFAVNRYGQVDDRVYGGGPGMVLMAEPLMRALESVADYREARTLVFSPRGRPLDQEKVEELSQEQHLVLVCGHYEGMDERFLEASAAEEISLGDFVLTGGELAALVLIDAVARRLPGVLPTAEVFADESFACGLLEQPQYTRPAVWRQRAVPEVLLSGHQANIDRWRRIRKLELTLRRRPDLLRGREDLQPLLEELLQELAENGPPDSLTKEK